MLFILCEVEGVKSGNVMNTETIITTLIESNNKKHRWITVENLSDKI